MKRWSLLAVLILAAWTSEVNSLGHSRALTDEQRRRLDVGQVVVLETLPPGGGRGAAEGGTALSVVHASPEEVWRVLVDYPRHSGLYPRVTTAEVIESDPRHALVRYVVGVGPFTFGFHVDNYPSAGRRRLDWRLAQGRSNGLFRDTWGYWHIEPHAEGVLLTYAMAARTMLPSFLTRGAERDGLVEALRAVKERAERRV